MGFCAGVVCGDDGAGMRGVVAGVDGGVDGVESGREERADWTGACDHRPCCWVAISPWPFPSTSVGNMGISSGVEVFYVLSR